MDWGVKAEGISPLRCECELDRWSCMTAAHYVEGPVWLVRWSQTAPLRLPDDHGLFHEQDSYVLHVVMLHVSLMSCLVPAGWLWQSCKMSMVLFASVVRVEDGLPLSASTDYEQDKDLQETKRHLKGLSKKLSQFPDRCTLKSGAFNVK